MRKKTYQVVQDLIPDDAHHLEALLAADRVDDHVAVDANEVLGVKDAVFILAGGVDHLDGKVMVAVADDLAESVLDGRVVGVDEVAVDVLHCERGFACARVVFVRRRVAFAFAGWWRRDESGRRGGIHTDRSTADDGHLALLLLRRHIVGGRRA